ncbi:TPA: nickel pincer cofactor biosynthesis protein LarB [Candidatus Poribacteria bacterium]|nr:nickel pincer cofactor biosynthesis protein LarB [Candidatus Poribacteria bacterium]
MSPERLRSLLENVRDGKVEVLDAIEALRDLPFEDLGFSRIDHHRSLRQSFPEVIFCQGKTVSQVVEIGTRIVEAAHPLLATRATKEMYNAIVEVFPEAKFNEKASTITVYELEESQLRDGILVISAGTSDIPVAEEAIETARIMGNRVGHLYDVGVAGLHRLLSCRDQIVAAKVLVVVAGMEGALASVVGGLVDKPVIAVPTSVGYGASFGGLAALLAMLNSCAAGVSVVNIDNGFGGGYAAALINQLSAESAVEK